MLIALHNKTVVTVNGKKYQVMGHGGQMTEENLVAEPKVELVPLGEDPHTAEKLVLSFASIACDTSSTALGLSKALVASQDR